MRSRTYLILTLFWCILSSIPPVRLAVSHAPTTTSLDSPTAAATTAVGLTPLPDSCGRGLPSGVGGPCCMFGYVLIDGQAAGGARITITNLTRGGQTETWTDNGPDSAQPYYRLSLSAAPLNVQVGDQLGILVQYSSHSNYLTSTAHADGQQVDVVLNRAYDNDDDYVYDRRIWQQTPPSTFNMVEADLAIDGANTIYVTDWVNARVQVFNRSGQFLREWGNLGAEPGEFLTPSGIAVDRLGHVYVTDLGSQRVQKFTSTGEWLTGWGQIGSGDGQLSWPMDVAVDDDGFVYVVERGNHRIQKFTADGGFVAKWGSQGSGSQQFDGPTGITIGPDGLLYIADTGNNRIQVFTRDGGFVRTWGSFGNGNGQLSGPSRVGVASNGDVYVSDTNNDRIQVFSNTGDYKGQWGSSGSDDGQFLSPGGIAFDTDGQVYIADSYNDRVQVFSAVGSYRSQWGHGGDSDGRFMQPGGIAIDSAGNSYVSDGVNGRIKKFGPDGRLLATWGHPGSGDGEFSSPGGIALDSVGNIYVADTYNGRIQVFRPDTTYLRQWGDLGDGDGLFRDPVGIAVSADGFVYVVDSGNHRLQKFTTQGVFQWKRGGPGPGSASGQFDYPRGVAVDSSGNIYVADTYNGRIQKFNAAGSFLLEWNGGSNPDHTIDTPEGVAVDAEGIVYVADFGNYRFQKYTNAGTLLLDWGWPGDGKGEFILPTRIAVAADSRVYVLERDLNRVTIVRHMTFTRPIATIVWAGPRSVTPGQSVALVGMGSDSDATPEIAGYEWTIDGNTTPFATSATPTLNTNGLAPGVHLVHLRVRDGEGEYSDPQTIQIMVSGSATWTFLLYLDGDNSATASYLDDTSPLGALYRLENSSSNPNVTVVALYDGDQSGGGDSYRYILRPGSSPQKIPVGEVNMGDPQTLIDFVAWGKQQAPADHYYLAIADHANALDGIAWDFTSAPNRTERITNPELRQALVAITDNGAQPLDILHFDGCLMGLIESAYQVRGMAHYLVASENLAWSAFAYSQYRDAVGSATSPSALANAIVDRYAAAVAAYHDPYTISAIDMSQIDPFVDQRFKPFAQELLRYALASQSNRDTLASLRQRVQTFDSGGNTVLTQEDEYVDLYHWAFLVSGISDSALRSAAISLYTALRPIVYEHHANGTIDGVPVNLDNAHGVAIYYPLHPSERTYQTYRNELAFATDTLWDEFLQSQLAPQAILPPQPPNPIAPRRLQQRIYLPAILR